jgi:hypothetical protein
MSRTDDRADTKLPVTAEVGGEGGSFADPTLQVETFSGVKGNPRVDPKTVSSATGEAAAVAAEGEQVRSGNDVVKHATDRPDED